MKKKPRILRIIHRFVLSGPMLNAALLSKHLESDFETLLIGGAEEETEANAQYIFDDLGVKYTKISEMQRSVNPLKDYPAYKKIQEIIHDFKPDIVHTHAAKAGAVGRYAAINAGVPVVLHTFHGHVFHSYFSPLKTRAFIEIERYLARKSSCIIAISEQQKKELAYDFKICPADKINVVPLGFDFSRFLDNQEEKREKFRNELGIESDTLAVGIIGRLAAVKNHKLFINAVKSISEKTSRKVRFFIVGDGETRPELEQQASDLGIATATPEKPNDKALLIFTSWRKDIDYVLAGIDIMALTSLNEGTPVSLIEAQAAKKPIVSTNVGGIMDVVKVGKSALLSPSDQLEPFVENLLALIENDKMRHDMAGEAHTYTLNKYGFKRLVNDFTLLYNNLLQK
jgi:glycosyltransferase involved in cell wall biosynthesis